MRFAEMVFMSLARRISSMMVEYVATTSAGRGSAVARQFVDIRVVESEWVLTCHGCGVTSLHCNKLGG